MANFPHGMAFSATRCRYYALPASSQSTYSRSSERTHRKSSYRNSTANKKTRNRTHDLYIEPNDLFTCRDASVPAVVCVCQTQAENKVYKLK